MSAGGSQPNWVGCWWGGGGGTHGCLVIDDGQVDPGGHYPFISGVSEGRASPACRPCVIPPPGDTGTAGGDQPRDTGCPRVPPKKRHKEVEGT